MLMIIDMQKEFELTCSAGDASVVNACCREIYDAAKSNLPIVIVKYRYNGFMVKPNPDELVDGLKEALDKVDPFLVTEVYKENDDGSKEISEAVYPPDWVRICGVNASACVRRTVNGLRLKRGWKQTSFIMVGDAIGDVYPGGVETALSDYSTKENFRVVNMKRSENRRLVSSLDHF